MVNIDADNGLSQVYSVGVIIQPRQRPSARSFVMGIAALNLRGPPHPTNVRSPCRSGLAREASAVALLLPVALPSTNRPNNAVPESRQEAETQRSGVTAAGWPAGRAQRVKRK